MNHFLETTESFTKRGQGKDHMRQSYVQLFRSLRKNVARINENEKS